MIKTKRLRRARLQNIRFLSRLLFRKPFFLIRLFHKYFRVLVLHDCPLRFMDIAVNYACNLNCRHCSATIMEKPGVPILSVEEYSRIAAGLRREGCLVFHFTGGEPLLRDDLEDIIRAFKSSHCGISVQTNGQLVTRERLLSLKRAGMDILCVSIDSGIAEEHDSFRRMPGAFDKAVKAVGIAKELGLRVALSTCISHKNLRTPGLQKLIEFVEEQDIWCYFNLAVPAGNWRENEDMLLTPEDRRYMENLLDKHPSCRTDFNNNYVRWGCSAVKEKLYLTAYGDVMPCPFIQISFGNLRKEDIGTIRRRALKIKVFQTYHQICIAAEDRDFISKCPCYTGQSRQIPVPYEEVDWMVKEIGTNPGTSSLKMTATPCPMCNAVNDKPVAHGRDFEYDTSDNEFRFMQCGKCGVLYLDPRPDPSELERIYPKHYAPYHFERRSLTLRVRDYLEGRRVRAIRQLIPETADVLDAGSGGAGFLKNLRRFGNRNWKLWGNDISDAVLSDMKRLGFFVIPGRFEQINMPDGSFNAVFLKQVLEHLDAPREALAKAAKLLRPGGVLIVETPNFDAWDRRIFQTRYWGGYHFPRHWTIFDPRTLAQACKGIGLEVESSSFMFSPSFWIQSAHHMLKDRGWPPVIYKRMHHLNPLVMSVAVFIDIIQKILCGRTSNMQMIFTKREIPAK